VFRPGTVTQYPGYRRRKARRHRYSLVWTYVLNHDVAVRLIHVKHEWIAESGIIVSGFSLLFLDAVRVFMYSRSPYDAGR